MSEASEQYIRVRLEEIERCTRTIDRLTREMSVGPGWTLSHVVKLAGIGCRYVQCRPEDFARYYNLLRPAERFKVNDPGLVGHNNLMLNGLTLYPILSPPADWPLGRFEMQNEHRQGIKEVHL